MKTVYSAKRYVLLTKNKLKSPYKEPIPFTRKEIAESWKLHYEERFGCEFIIKEVNYILTMTK